MYVGARDAYLYDVHSTMYKVALLCTTYHVHSTMRDKVRCTSYKVQYKVQGTVLCTRT